MEIVTLTILLLLMSYLIITEVIESIILHFEKKEYERRKKEHKINKMLFYDTKLK